MALCWEDGLEAKGGLACIHNIITIGFRREHMMLQCKCNCSDSALCIKLASQQVEMPQDG